MSLEHSPGRGQDGPDLDYWNALINEKAAADFLDLSDRTMQSLRQKGGGPKFFRLSARAVKYRRRDLRDWTDARAASSTAEYPE